MADSLPFSISNILRSDFSNPSGANTSQRIVLKKSQDEKPPHTGCYRDKMETSHSLDETCCGKYREGISTCSELEQTKRGQNLPRKTPKDGQKESYSTQGQKRGRETKKKRTIFAKEQVNLLENVFSSQKYLSRDERALLARDVNLSKYQVRTWFQNRRYQLKHPRSDG